MLLKQNKHEALLRFSVNRLLETIIYQIVGVKTA